MHVIPVICACMHACIHTYSQASMNDRIRCEAHTCIQSTHMHVHTCMKHTHAFKHMHEAHTCIHHTHSCETCLLRCWFHITCTHTYTCMQKCVHAYITTHTHTHTHISYSVCSKRSAHMHTHACKNEYTHA
jgi:hypothetical protein